MGLSVLSVLSVLLELISQPFPDKMEVLSLFSFLSFIFLQIDTATPNKYGPTMDPDIFEESGVIRYIEPCPLGFYRSPNRNKCVGERRHAKFVTSTTTTTTTTTTTLWTESVSYLTDGSTDPPHVPKSGLGTDPTPTSSLPGHHAGPEAAKSEPNDPNLEPRDPNSEPNVENSEPEAKYSGLGADSASSLIRLPCPLTVVLVYILCLQM